MPFPEGHVYDMPYPWGNPASWSPDFTLWSAWVPPEHAWGTDGLAKLEAIKAKVDPQGLFQCQKCVGFKGPVRDY